MQKNALAITVGTVVMGIFGAFLRWLQNRIIFEADTGLAVRGAGISIVYVIFSILVFVVILGTVLGWLRRCAPAEPEAALRTESVLPTVLAWVLCALFALGGLARMFSAGAATSPLLQRVFGAAAILAGVCLPALPARVSGAVSLRSRRMASIFLTLFFSLWLITSYLTNAQDPVLWNYAPEILAIAASTLALYYTSALLHGRPGRNAALVTTAFGVFLNFCTLPDTRSRGMTLLFAATAVALLLVEYLLLSNLREEIPEE